MLIQLSFIASGAVLGALLRWQLGIWLNPVVSHFSLGTFLANSIGCLLIGVAMGFNLHDNHKLLMITGFLGSFTTFSSFSAEVIEQFLAGKWLNGALIFSLHTVVGLGATVFGVFLAKLMHKI